MNIVQHAAVDNGICAGPKCCICIPLGNDIAEIEINSVAVWCALSRSRSRPWRTVIVYRMNVLQHLLIYDVSKLHNWLLCAIFHMVESARWHTSVQRCGTNGPTVNMTDTNRFCSERIVRCPLQISIFFYFIGVHCIAKMNESHRVWTWTITCNNKCKRRCTGLYDRIVQNVFDKIKTYYSKYTVIVPNILFSLFVYNGVRMWKPTHWDSISQF